MTGLVVESVTATPAGLRADCADADGNKVLVIHLWRDTDECSMCSAIGFHSHAVPWYCGPVASGENEGGYKTVCKKCHDRWAAWDDSLRYYGA